MGEYRTAEEVEQHYRKILGDEFGPIFHAIYNQLSWLYIKWEQYVEVYGTKPSRIDLINTTAPLFFRVVQDSLFEDIIIHIARLTDPPKSVGKPNLSIRQFPNLIKDDDLRSNIEQKIDETLKLVSFCRDWRNRRIAHNDLQIALKDGANPLESASRKKVRDALESISSVLNEISVYYFDSTILFGETSSPGGALSLLHIIHDGLTARKERRERIKTKTYRPEDFNRPDL